MARKIEYKDANGNLVAPKTIAEQVIMADGQNLEEKLENFTPGGGGGGRIDYISMHSSPRLRMAAAMMAMSSPTAVAEPDIVYYQCAIPDVSLYGGDYRKISGYSLSEYIPVAAGYKVKISNAVVEGSLQSCCAYDKNIKYTKQMNDGDIFTEDGFVRFSAKNPTEKTFALEIPTDAKKIIFEKINIPSYVTGYLDKSNILQQHTNFLTSDYIPVKKGDYLKFSLEKNGFDISSAFYFYNSKKDFIKNTDGAGKYGCYLNIVENDGFVRFSIVKADESKDLLFKLVDGSGTAEEIIYSLSATPQSLDFISAGESKDLSILSQKDLGGEISDVAFTTRIDGEGFSIIGNTVTATENVSSAPRSATLFITQSEEGGKEISVPLSQAAKEDIPSEKTYQLSVNPTSLDFAENGGTKTFSVNSVVIENGHSQSVAYDVTVSGAGFSVSDNNVTAEVNNGSARNGQIVVKQRESNKQVIIPLSQSAKEDVPSEKIYEISVNPSSLKFDGSGGSKSFTVNSVVRENGRSKSVAYDITISGAGFSVNGNTVTAGNNYGSARKGTVVVKQKESNKQVVVSLTQDAHTTPQPSTGIEDIILRDTVNGKELAPKTHIENIFDKKGNRIGEEIKELLKPSQNILNPEEIYYGTHLDANGRPTTLIKDGDKLGTAKIANLKGNTWYVFSSNQYLDNSDGFNVISCMQGADLVAFARKRDYSELGGPQASSLEVVRQQDSNGFKFRLKLDISFDFYIYVGQKGKTSNLQLEEGESPTAFVPYGIDLGKNYDKDIELINQKISALNTKVDNAKSVPSRWAGCSYVAAGDSITDERFSPARKYCTIIKESLGCISYLNIGRSGSTIADRAGVDWTNSFVTYMGSTDFSKYDLMTMCFGTNDSFYDIPLGSIDDEDTKTTFYGAYQSAIKYIFNANKTIRLILITPYQSTRGYKQNANGDNLNDFANAVKKIAEKFSLPVLDFYSCAGINKLNIGTYTLDALHPNAIGHEFSGGYAVAQIKNM